MSEFPVQVGKVISSSLLRGDFYNGMPESLRATVRTPRHPTNRFAGFGFHCAADYTLPGQRTY